MKSAFYDGLKAKAVIFCHVRAKRFSYTLTNNERCIKIPEKFDAFREFSSFSIGRQVVGTTSAG